MNKDKESFSQHCTKLMQKAQKGCHESYHQLLQELTPFLRRIVSTRINSNNDAEDIVQEILLSLHKARATYNTERPFLPWLMGIAHYRLVDYLRKIYNNNDKIAPISYEEIAQYITNEENNVTNNDVRVEYIEEAITILPTRQQKIITLTHNEGYTAKEVAEKLGMTTSAVKVAIHRAHKKIKKIIDNKEET